MDSPLFHAYSIISHYFCKISGLHGKDAPMSSSVKKRALNSLVLLPDGVTLKISPKGVATTARACGQEPCPFPPIFQNIIHFNLCLLCSSLSLLKKYEQDLLLNWSKCYREHAAFNAKFGEILQHISTGRLNCTL